MLQRLRIRITYGRLSHIVIFYAVPKQIWKLKIEIRIALVQKELWKKDKKTRMNERREKVRPTIEEILR